jgi:hypothetical protein
VGLRLSSFVICGAASLYPAWNWAHRLLSACLWFFAAKAPAIPTSSIHILYTHTRAYVHEFQKKPQKNGSPILAALPPVNPKTLRDCGPKTRAA